MDIQVLSRETTGAHGLWDQLWAEKMDFVRKSMTEQGELYKLLETFIWTKSQWGIHQQIVKCRSQNPSCDLPKLQHSRPQHTIPQTILWENLCIKNEGFLSLLSMEQMFLCWLKCIKEGNKWLAENVSARLELFLYNMACGEPSSYNPDVPLYFFQFIKY